MGHSPNFGKQTETEKNGLAVLQFTRNNCHKKPSNKQIIQVRVKVIMKGLGYNFPVLFKVDRES